jgi:hypothetical protein
VPLFVFLGTIPPPNTKMVALRTAVGNFMYPIAGCHRRDSSLYGGSGWLLRGRTSARNAQHCFLDYLLPTVVGKGRQITEIEAKISTSRSNFGVFTRPTHKTDVPLALTNENVLKLKN